MRTFENDDYCFVCGRDNPLGLKLRPAPEDGRCDLDWIPGKEFQGWEGVVHGGILTALLDEAMAYSAMSAGGASYATATISVDFVRPVRTGVPVRIEAETIENRGRLVRTEAVLTQDGEVRARARASFVRVG